MTPEPGPRRRLTLVNTPRPHRHGSRSMVTCFYRCGNACDHPVPNTSDNEYFGDIVASAVSRRVVLGGGAAAAAGALVVAVIGGSPAAASDEPPADLDPTSLASRPDASATGSALTFPVIPPNTLDCVVVPNGYDHAVVISWGDPVERGAPAFDPTRQTGAAQAKQFGYNNDYVGVLPLSRHGRSALLVVNHEYTNENLMFPGFTSLNDLTLEQIRVAMAAHGLSIVELGRKNGTGQWTVAKDGRRHNRRITINTRFRFDGPAAGSPLLRTAADPAGSTPLGTLNNCAGGLTPWGTVLSGEENFNQYFVGGDGVDADTKPRLDRYGIDSANRYPAGSRKWDRVDERFDLSRHPNEANRFGWVVEVDPYDRTSVPVKHTALGRFKHEGANVRLAPDGRAVVYMGDDERFDYIYKFVSDKAMRRGRWARDRAHNLALLSSGTLYVAKLSGNSTGEIDGSGTLPSDGAFDGSGTWIPLARGNESLVPGMSVEEILVFTRQAGDAVGATKMDRPEDIEPNPVTGKVYCALTNNTNRGGAGRATADEANPRNSNRHGHILEITENGNDPTSTSFTWSLPIVCGDPEDPSTYFAGYDKAKVSPISCPDNVAFDGAGNLWIATDGNALGSNDGLFAVPLAGTERGRVKQFLTVPKGAETCGPFITTDQRSVFVAVQHPGEVDGSSFDDPASTWPYGDHPRPSIVVTWRTAPGSSRIGA